MTRLGLCAALGAAISLASNAMAYAADASCKNPKTQPELSACAGKDAQAADAVLNRVYGQLIAKYDNPIAVRSYSRNAPGSSIATRNATTRPR